jgi:hypothetical protein
MGMNFADANGCRRCFRKSKTMEYKDDRLQAETDRKPASELELIEQWLRALPGGEAKELEHALAARDSGALARFHAWFREWMGRAHG